MKAYISCWHISHRIRCTRWSVWQLSCLITICPCLPTLPSPKPWPHPPHIFTGNYLTNMTIWWWIAVWLVARNLILRTEIDMFFFVWAFVYIYILAYMLGYADPWCTLDNRAICIDKLRGQARVTHPTSGTNVGRQEEKGDIDAPSLDFISDPSGEMSKMRKYSLHNFPPCKQYVRSSSSSSSSPHPFPQIFWILTRHSPLQLSVSKTRN